ncbi:MAG: hypothetical protein COU47_00935 [Candidatus Niyogibacteria bacterium CG10_big_fil_rev_8_21_14_0_10_46_36]|uniref:Uncharacterized protein n=1 Tax=Candidatus Niyogibacteria bacterium CG10_big_fil_rev_8_21_14_0_10_46_36 TaxID=1974726 RepID=A0A2H0TEL8_9BACT|nr:MAG: hypothetical protein COU47_00935 [Candidatus Niyogibacteria bacterium CG10_big_fil_rev_8_21_14_0_10_46_36]
MKKTIFFSVYDVHVFRNLFLPPDSVVRKLVLRGDHNIVILRRSQVLPEFFSAEELKNMPHVVIENISYFRPKTRLERAFHFFYSYLVFTGTTKLLATVGDRLDAPPAGGNRHLWVIKWVIAHTFGKFNIIKRNVVPWLYQKIFTERPYKALFDTHNPDLVFCSDIAHFPDIEIAAEAKRRNIKTAGMPSKWDHFNKYFVPVQTDVLAVQNEPMKKEAVKYEGYKSSEVDVVGFPQWDNYYGIERHVIQRDEFLKKMGMPGDSKVILFVSGSVYAADEPDILQAISNQISKGFFGPSVRLLLRPYPQTSEKAKYLQFEQDQNVFINWIDNTNSMDNFLHYVNMMYHADVVISLFSTTAIEAAIFDKPVLTIGFDGYKKRPYHQSVRRWEDLAHFRHVLDTGSVKVIKSFPELFAQIRAYLDDPGQDRELRKDLVDKMCYKIDGRSSERLANFILQNA